MAIHPDGRSRISSRAPSRGPTHRPSVWAGGLSIFLLLIIIAIRFAGDSLFAYPANPKPLRLPRHSAVVVLAGGKHRIEAAFSLFADAIGDELWVIGAGRKSTAMSLAKAQGIEAAQRISWDRMEKILVETESKDTLDNAYAVRRLLEQHPQIRTLLIVTSAYHMRRALLVLAHNMPSGVELIPYTPETSELGPANWWHSWGGISLTVAELLKLQVASIVVPRLSYF